MILTASLQARRQHYKIFMPQSSSGLKQSGVYAGRKNIADGRPTYGQPMLQSQVPT